MVFLRFSDGMFFRFCFLWHLLRVFLDMFLRFRMGFLEVFYGFLRVFKGFSLACSKVCFFFREF